MKKFFFTFFILLLLPATALAAGGTLGSSNNTSTLTSGLVGYWSLDGNKTNWLTGTTQDSSGQGNTGLLVGMSTTTSPVPGKIGEALNFNGTSGQYVSLGSPASLEGLQLPLTISGWFKQTTTSGLQPIYAAYLSASGSNLWSLVRIDNGTLIYYASTAAGSFQSVGSFTPAVGKWHYFSVVVSGTVASPTVTIYLDGASQSFAIAALSASPSNIPLYVGADGNSASERFKGAIDDLRIYNRALSASEVRQLYSTGLANIGHSNTTTLQTGLLAYWPFDGNTTNWKTGGSIDVSGHGNLGQLIGMSTTTSPVAGKIGGALNLNGSSQYIDVPMVLTPSTFTVSTWFKGTSFAGVSNPRIVSNSHTDTDSKGFQLMFGTGGAAGFFDVGVSGAGVCTASWIQTLSVGKWYHYVGVYDGTKVNAYINGALVGTGPCVGGAMVATGVDVNVGRDGAYAGDYFNGAVDDTRIYSRALSANDVKQLYNSGAANIDHSNTTTLQSGLVGYWTFDGPNTNWNTDTVLDSSGQGNTGQMISMSTSSSPVAGKIGQALKFNGISSYVDVGNASVLSFASGVTLAAWVKLNSGFSSGYEAIAGKWADSGGRSYLLSFGSSGVGHNDVAFFLDSNGTQTSVLDGSASQSTFVGGWHHIVAVYNSAAQTQTLYVDGKFDTSKTYTAGFQGNSLHFEIGNHNSNDVYFNGSIDEVRVYNRALSAQEVQQLYQLGK